MGLSGAVANDLLTAYKPPTGRAVAPAVLAGTAAAVDAFVAEAVRRAAATARMSGSDGVIDKEALEQVLVQLLLDFAGGG